MIYLKKTLLKMLRLIVSDVKKSKNNRKKVKENKKIGAIPKARGFSHVRDRRGAMRNIDLIPDYLFKRIFRLDKTTFAMLLAKITPLIGKNKAKAELNGSGGEISPEIMLLATLRFLAGGMKWDICLALDIGFGSYWGERGVIWPTIYAIDCLTDFEIGLPLNEEAEMRKIAEEFAAMCPNSSEQFWGCVMAVDGWICATRKPKKDETRFPRYSMCMKVSYCT